MNRKMKGLFASLALAFIASSAFIVYLLQEREEVRLDAYGHTQYSRVLQHYERDIMRIAFEIELKIARVLAAESISRSDLSWLRLNVEMLSRSQVDYSLLIQDYNLNGREYVLRLIDGEMPDLDFKSGLYFYSGTINTLTALELRQPYEETISLNASDFDQLEVSLQLAVRHRELFERHLVPGFNADDLHQAILTRLALHEELTSILPELHDFAYSHGL